MSNFYSQARGGVLLVAGLLFFFIAANFALDSHELRRSDLNDAALRIDGYNKLIAEQLDSTLVRIGGVLGHVVNLNLRAQQSRTVPDWNELLLAAHAGLASANVLARIGPDGVVLQATNPAFVGRLVKPDSVFYALRDGAAGNVVSPAAFRGPISGVYQVSVGRRIEDSHGQFRGAVIGTVDLDRLSALYATLKLERGIVIEARHANGNPLLRVGVDGAATADDRQAQFITSARRLEHFPLIVSVSIDRSEVLAAWRRHLIGNGTVTAAVLLALLAGTYFIGRQLMHQRLSNEALRESEERYRRTFEFAGVGFAHVSTEGRMLRVNRTLCAMLGYTPEELVGRAGKEFAHADDRGLAAAVRARMLAGAMDSARIEKRYLCKDGSTLWANVTLVLMRDDDGEPMYFVFVIEDISERKLAQDALVVNERRFRSMVEHSTDGVNLSDAEFRLLYRSPASARISGYSDEERIGRRDTEMPGMEEWAAWRVAHASELRVPGRSVALHTSLRRKDGSLRWIEGTVTNLLDEPAVGAILANFRDVTERKLAEQRLAESELRLRRILEVNAEPTLLTDEQGTIQFANAAAAELLGRGEPTLAGSPLGLPLDSGRPAEVDVLRPDGEVRTAEMRFARTLIGEDAMLVVSLHDLSERKNYEQHIKHLANHDALTGLPNRNLLRDRTEQAMLQARREGRQLALLFVDLDRFKLVNDSWGHPFGDLLLAETAKRLSAAVREGDTIARLGGDEFVILLPELKRAERAIRVAEKVLAALALPFEAEGRIVPVTASLGIATYPVDGETLEALLQSADAAMYRAKDLGRGGYQFYSADMGKNARDRAEMEAALHLAIERGELEMHYQPQVDLATGRVVGFEALMRWTRDGAAISPARFIPIAEESGLIVQMGDWALRTACGQAAAWRDAGLGRYRIAVNLSARQFWEGRVAASVAGALAASGAEPDLLEVEITEGVVLRDVDEVMRSLAQLRQTGVTVAIDDFGTGYSSLAYLRSLPIDKLKVDKAFLKGTPEDPDACAFVAGIIQLAHVLKLLVVAEGVEQQGQSVFLRHAGCERMQGFLFSPALDAISCEALLREDRVLA